MEQETKNLATMDSDNYIDKYLDGLLSEEEMDEFETRCLEDKYFFHKVAERKRLREKVTQVIKKNGEEIFLEYAKKEFLPKAEKLDESLAAKIVQLWSNVKPIWKFSLVPVGVAIVLLILLLSPVEEAFQKNAELENELGIKNYRSEELKILSPKQGKVFYEQVTFAWQTSSKGLFELQILNNKAEIIDSTKTTETSFRFANSLSPGLYYWKLYDPKGYLAHIGKFYIKKKL